MRALVLSDIHSNLDALEAVLDAARAEDYDRVLVLGDVVGYGADPNGVIDRLRALPGLLAVRGNHDRVAIARDDPEAFNEAARLAALWTRGALTPSSRAFLETLPAGPLEYAPGRLLCHGAPHDEDRYLMDASEAGRAFQATPFEVAFFGHSHFPGAFVQHPDGRVTAHPATGEETLLNLQAGSRSLVNPGSVGQPRDRDPRCGFALYDEAAATVRIRRLVYPAQVARDRIVAAGLPRWLGDRLLLGV